MSREGEARTFFEAVWGDDPEDGQHILIWQLEGKRSSWFDTLDAAIEFAASAEGDTYAGVALAPKAYGRSERCKAEDVSSIAGFWADVDYQHENAHKATNLPPDQMAASRLLNECGLSPSMVVHSGYGLQAWWLFKEPLFITGETHRKRIAETIQGWQLHLAQKAGEHGWAIDRTHDLARIMRVPGTFNCKGEKRLVSIIAHDESIRYTDLDDFELFIPEPEVAAHGVYGEARPPEWWDRAMGGVDEGDPEGGRDVTMASLIGKYLSNPNIDVTDIDTAASLMPLFLMVNERNRPPMPQADVRRIFGSILKRENKRRRLEAAAAEVEEDMLGQAEIIDEAVMPPEDVQWSKLRKALGGLPIVGVYQHGEQDSTYSIRVQTMDDLIPIGNPLNQNGVAKAIMDAGHYAIPLKKAPKWREICTSLCQLATLIESPTRQRSINELLVEWLATNAAVHPPSQRDFACSTKQPFIDDQGMMRVHLEKFQMYLAPMGERISRSELCKSLTLVGWKRETLGYQVMKGEKATGKRSTISYWTQSLGKLDIVHRLPDHVRAELNGSATAEVSDDGEHGD